MEIMGKTEAERDRDQTKMARIWIEPPYFIALVSGVYVRVDSCPPPSVERERRRYGDRKRVTSEIRSSKRKRAT